MHLLGPYLIGHAQHPASDPFLRSHLGPTLCPTLSTRQGEGGQGLHRQLHAVLTEHCDVMVDFDR